MLGIKLTLSLDTIKDIINGADLPLLMFDQYWLALLPREYKTQRMKDSEKKIVELMKEEARIRENTRIMAAKKSAALEKINSLASQAYLLDNKKAKKEIKDSKAVILKANSFFLLAERRLKNIEEEIKGENRAILEETVKISYGAMQTSKERIDVLGPEIEALREELKQKITEISYHEQAYDSSYHLLHKLVGKDIINRLDRQTEASEKKKWFWA